MLVPGVGDLRYKGLLTELRLNPTWERWRANLLTTSFICALGGPTLDCVPLKSNTSDILLFAGNKVTLSASQTRFVNQVCANQISPSVFTLHGYIMLINSVIILRISSDWLNDKVVSKTLCKFAQCRDEFLERQRVTNDEQRLTDDLDKYLEEISKTAAHVLTKYRQRCKYLLWMLFAYVGLSITEAVSVHKIADPALCRLGELSLGKETSEMPITSFTCMTEQRFTVLVFIGMYILLLIMQFHLIVKDGYRIASGILRNHPDKPMLLMVAFTASCDSVNSESFTEHVIDFLTRRNANGLTENIV